MKVTIKWTIIAILFIITGCFGDDSDDPAKNTLPSLDGTWARTSYVWESEGDDGTKGTNDDHWILRQIVFSGDNATITDTYADGTAADSLTSPIFSIEQAFTYTTVSSGTAEIYNINFTQVSAKWTPLTSTAASIFNSFDSSNGLFAYTDWTVNVAKDVTNRKYSSGDATASYIPGTVYYQIIHLQNNNTEMLLGDDTGTKDGTSQSSRPDTLNITPLNR